MRMSGPCLTLLRGNRVVWAGIGLVMRSYVQDLYASHIRLVHVQE